MSACILILLVRIFGALFAVIMSSMLVIASLFLHIANEPSTLVDYLSLLLVAVSSIFLFGTLVSAKRFSDTVREKVAPRSTEGRKVI
jgi:hypothetical protein